MVTSPCRARFAVVGRDRAPASSRQRCRASTPRRWRTTYRGGNDRAGRRRRGGAGAHRAPRRGRRLDRARATRSAARRRARPRPAAGGGRAAAALRPSVRGEGQHRRRRAAHDGGLSRLRLSARGARVGGGAADRGRRAGRRQDQPRSVRDRAGRCPVALRRRPQTVRRSLHRRRLQLGLGGGRRRGGWSASRSGPTRPARGASRRRSTTSSASSPAAACSAPTGVVPACRSLDCVSVFALTVEDAVSVADVACGLDLGDPGSRPDADGFRFQPTPRPPHFRFGVPAGPALELSRRRTHGRALRARASATCGDGRRARRHRLRALPGSGQPALRGRVRRRTAGGGGTDAGGESGRRSSGPCAPSWKARRVSTRARRSRRSTGWRDCGGGRARCSASVDFLFVPTTPTIYTIDEVEASPLRLNAQLGTYVNFVNLLDLAAMAVPLGFRDGRLARAGATLIAPWGRDASLATFGSALHRKTSQTMGATGAPLRPPPAPAASAAGDERIDDRGGRRAPVRRAAQSPADRARRAFRSRGPHRGRPTGCTRCRARRRPSPA